jgi:hypothetical protein
MLFATPRPSLAIESGDILSARPMGDLCNIECSTCGVHTEIAQTVTLPNQGSHPGTQDQDCHVFEGGCDGLGSCSQDRQQQLEELGLYAAIQDGDVDAVQTALVKLGEDASVNSERGAIQVFGCNKQVLAHLPINAAMLGALQ